MAEPASDSAFMVCAAAGAAMTERPKINHRVFAIGFVRATNISSSVHSQNCRPSKKKHFVPLLMNMPCCFDRDARFAASLLFGGLVTDAMEQARPSFVSVKEMLPRRRAASRPDRK